jgi:hypothetical protein
MPALDREDLSDACRQIYMMAGNDFMLPPLLRDANALGDGSKHTYFGLTKSDCVRLIIELDKTYLNRSSFPLSRLPLKFTCELCDLDFKETPVQLSASESKELIRAFFLGVKTPINAELNPVTRGIKFSIQLSSSFHVEFGEMPTESHKLAPEAICRWVGGSLYDKSQEFFGSAQDGMSVWIARTTQELFGEQKPSPETYWPHEPLRTAVTIENAPIVAVAGAPVLACETTDRCIVGQSHEAPVIATERPSLYHAALAAMLVAMAGASFLPLAAHTPANPIKTTESALAPMKEAPAIVAQFDFEKPQAGISKSEPVMELAPAAAPIPLSQPECVSPALAGGAPQLEASKPPEASSGKPALAPKSQALARKTVRNKTARLPAQPQQANPLVAVGRAAGKVVSSVVTNLQRLPNQLSTMMR